MPSEWPLLSIHAVETQGPEFVDEGDVDEFSAEEEDDDDVDDDDDEGGEAGFTHCSIA